MSKTHIVVLKIVCAHKPFANKMKTVTFCQVFETCNKYTYLNNIVSLQPKRFFLGWKMNFGNHLQQPMSPQ